jgi:Icc-related predicted phosphoesterase
MTKVVLISDTHGMEPKVPDGDILIHAGDLTMMGTYTQVAKAGTWLRSLPHKHKVVIAGNHDYLFEKNLPDARAMLGPGIQYLENSSTTIDGLKIYGSPVQPRFFDWAFNVDRGEAIRKYWDMIPEGVDILVTHGPPRGILDQANAKLRTEHCGCDDLWDAIHRNPPKIHVFGHIHGGYGTETTKFGTVCYNASVVDEAYKLANKPWVVELFTK